MNIKNFTISGFARFYRSLLRFNRDMDNYYALKLTYGLYASINEVHRYKHPDVCFKEYNENDFSNMLQKSDKKPYKTIIQFYCSLEALYLGISKTLDRLNTNQLKCFMSILNMMDDTEFRFRKAFNLEIYDKRTVYYICVRNLTPRRNEPGLCILQDWIDAAAEKNQGA